jgi:hypothetical protein
MARAVTDGPTWDVTRGTSEPFSWGWIDQGGPVLLSGVQLRLRIIGWEGEVLELLSGVDPEITIDDQVVARGLWRVQLSEEQVALLPVEPPPRYEWTAIIDDIVAPVRSGPMRVRSAGT